MSAEQFPPAIEQPSNIGVMDRLRSRGTTLVAAGAALVAIGASPLFEERPAYADTGQVVVGMPFDGKWAYSNNVEPPYTDSNSSHPSVHHVPGGGDWGTDLYAAAGKEVKLKVSGAGNMTFSWGAGTTSCGEARRINVNVDNTQVGTLYVAHLSEAASTATAPTNGMTIGKIANLACNPGGTGKHVHIEFKNSANYSCYANYGNPGATLAEGSNLGVLGSGNNGVKQECSAIPGGGTPPAQYPLSLLDFSDAIWSKKNLGVGWTQETGPSSAKSISAGGSNRIILDQCHAVWAKTGDPSWSGWTQETGCYAGSKVIVSSTGVRMILDFCGAVWAKNGTPGMGGWIQETGCDGVKDIAVGGDNQLLLNACNQVWSKPGIGFGGWTPESDCGGAEKIAISSTGVKVVINGCGAVWAKKPGNGWAQETGCDGVKTIAAGEGENQLLLNACDAVWSKPGVGFGGWTQETDCGAAKAIAMGSHNRRAILDFGDAIWAKDNAGYGGWSQQTGAGSAKAVDVG